MSGGGDLRVLATAFEQCQGAFRTQGGAISALAGRLRSDAGALGSKNVGGDGCGDLARQVDQLASALSQVGDTGCQGVVTGIQRILDKFHEVDRAQAANVPPRP